ncbi:MAG: CBS domain-containing protein [Deltaproteobacteria bacterium]|nr:CBS domain-containing protein [Deltaproteobacteria bacterium]MBW1934750.1 CBS domain-containing protein [Deltaproteobacteria bacterium]MBW1977093.1 CBS domain-containing protein [Deltaproteobacteria bacterium]MBW2044116.1 CBS domain-containing protein [Deltaproteobacteria bacterium]MBW2300880.1 CBS domain-containing protein [Deltaproteobacteria bacterium]
MGKKCNSNSALLTQNNTEEVITTHTNADFDALASMLAAKKLYPNATLVFPGSQEKNLRNFFLHSTSYLFDFTKMKHLDLSKIKRLILVDTRQKSRIGKFSRLVEEGKVEIHIYDHHHESDEDIHGEVEVIQEVGATTSILTQIIKEKNIPISPDEATIMCLGIHEDTGSFSFASTKALDHEAAAWLMEKGANTNLIADMLTREFTAEQLWLLSDLTKSATKHVINGVEVVVSKVTRDEYVGDLAVLVHKFMEMENLDVIIALAQMEDKIYLVARSRVEEVNVAEIALAFGGGGHPQAASATIKNKTLIQVEKTLQALLASRISPQKKARDMMSSPVINISPEKTLKEAATALTKYNINVLLVIGQKEELLGYITRQIVEKAVYLGLGNRQIKEYMNIEFSTVSPDAPLKEVQELIIENKLRILPVIENDKVVGVITRTDLLNILVGGPVVPDFFYETRHAPHFLRKKNVAGLLKERLPRRLIQLFKEFGNVADMMGYNAYLVGGIVRDVILKRENLDVDIVIEGDGIKFAHEYAAHHEVKVRSHKKFGTVVLVFPDGFKVDIATARIEYYDSPAAPPTVETSSLKMDLYRRDFTINTLAVKLNKRDYGTLVDYFGAQKDIREKVIRVLHNLSFVEDPTRVLRAIRFEQRFGLKIGKLTLALMKNAVAINCFKDLSGRRLFLEIKLLLMEREPLKAIERMNEFGLLQVISPALNLTRDLRNLLQNVQGVISWFDLLYLDEPYEPWKVYWHALTSTLDKRALNQVSKRMQLGEKEKQILIDQQLEANKAIEKLYRIKGAKNYQLYTLLSRYDTEILLWLMAKANNPTIKKQISTYFTKLKNSESILKGKDLKKIGFEPGPLYKKIFDSLLEARINNQVSTKQDEIRFVKEKFSEHLKTAA